MKIDGALLFAICALSVAVDTVFAATGSAGAVNSIGSHCALDEQVVFSCNVRPSGKMMSLCASRSLETKSRYLQYRFGRKGNVELEFPPQRSGSVDRFKLSHYSRADVDRWEVTFSNKSARYSVFSSVEGEVRPVTYEAGIEVEKEIIGAEGNPETYRCSSPYVDHLGILEGILKCDPESGLSLNDCR